MRWSLLIVLFMIGSMGCEEHLSRDNFDSQITRRITAPSAQDTLYVGMPFRVIAGVECHNPILAVRIDITDGSQDGPYGDGEIAFQATLPTRGNPLIVDVDTMLTIPRLEAEAADQRYSFYLVEVYEGREFRNGFSPLVILNQE